MSKKYKHSLYCSFKNAHLTVSCISFYTALTFNPIQEAAFLVLLQYFSQTVTFPWN